MSSLQPTKAVEMEPFFETNPHTGESRLNVFVHLSKGQSIEKPSKNFIQKHSNGYGSNFAPSTPHLREMSVSASMNKPMLNPYYADKRSFECQNASNSTSKFLQDGVMHTNSNPSYLKSKYFELPSPRDWAGFDDAMERRTLFGIDQSSTLDEVEVVGDSEFPFSMDFLSE